MKKKRMPTPGAFRYWNTSMSNWECDGDTCQLCFQLSFISMVISGPNQRILYLNYQKSLRFFPLTFQLYTFVLTGLRKGFLSSYKKNLQISSNLSTMFFVLSSPQQRLAYTWVSDGTESKICKNWSPIWCVQTGFCPKRYRSLHDRSLETVNWFSHWILRPMAY